MTNINAPFMKIASVTGTDGDPQDRISQIAKLEVAGILAAPSRTLMQQKLALACLKLEC